MRHVSNSTRRAFTLIELLVVVAIISLLAALSTMAVMAVLGRAKVQATQGTLRAIQQALQQRIDAYQRATDTLVKLKGIENVNQYAAAAGNNAALAEIIARKAAFQKYFPQTWAEAKLALLQQQPDYSQVPTTPNPATESAEVLFFMLTRSAVLGYSPEGNDLFTGTSQVRDTDNNGAPEFIDAWGKPLRFYRWPTRLLMPSGYVSTGITTTNFETARILIEGLPTNLADGNLDPDDPLSLIYSATLQSSPPFTAADFEKKYHTMRVWHAPLVVSGGPDEETGLLEPSNQASFGYLAAKDKDTSSAAKLNDNITTLNIKAGGK